jgi:trehalose utilization protein
MSIAPNVLIWNEGRHEKHNPEVARIYPDGLPSPIAAHLRANGLETRIATLDEPEHGLTPEALAWAEVLIWWGHLAHNEVHDDIVARVRQRVLDGLGLIVLHSGHFSKIFKALMGTTCDLKWRAVGEKERLWVVAPGHPIAAGLGEYFEIEREEMYGEFFDIPAPETLVFVSWFNGGEVFRSGCCYQRGRGKVFYFRPGHETYPTYHQPQVLQVIYNAALWAATNAESQVTFGHRPHPLETLT